VLPAPTVDHADHYATNLSVAEPSPEWKVCKLLKCKTTTILSYLDVAHGLAIKTIKFICLI